MNSLFYGELRLPFEETLPNQPKLIRPDATLALLRKELPPNKTPGMQHLELLNTLNRHFRQCPLAANHLFANPSLASPICTTLIHCFYACLSAEQASSIAMLSRSILTLLLKNLLQKSQTFRSLTTILMDNYYKGTLNPEMIAEGAQISKEIWESNSKSGIYFLGGEYQGLKLLLHDNSWKFPKGLILIIWIEQSYVCENAIILQATFSNNLKITLLANRGKLLLVTSHKGNKAADGESSVGTLKLHETSRIVIGLRPHESLFKGGYELFEGGSKWTGVRALKIDANIQRLIYQ